MNIVARNKPVQVETVRISSNEVAGWRTGFVGRVRTRKDLLWEDVQRVMITVNFSIQAAVQSGFWTFVLMDDHCRRLVTVGGKKQLEPEKFNIRWDHPASVTEPTQETE